MIFGFFFFSGATISRPPIEVQISADSYLRERISSFTFLPFFLQFLTSLTFPGLRIFLNTSLKGKIPHFAQKQDNPEWMKFNIWELKIFITIIYHVKALKLCFKDKWPVCTQLCTHVWCTLFFTKIQCWCFTELYLVETKIFLHHIQNFIQICN